jgi:uncharacterized protein YjbI with pentapeptide repeats
MANEEHLNRVRARKAIWNEWRDRNPDIIPDLSNADLNRADLFERNLSGANLYKSDLHAADLRRANLENANLESTRLRHASLRHANLSGANLIEADLYNANLYKANLNNAKLIKADLMGADLTQANLARTDLTNAKLALSRLIDTDLTKAILTGCCIYGISAWNVNLEGAVQSNLVVNPLNEPTITVDNLEVAQFIYLLINNAKIRDVINTVTSKVVLILGRFTPERKLILDALREELRKHDLLPVLFDFDKPSGRDIQETVTTLARLARFVVADITEPKSIPQELVSIVETMPSLPVQPLLQKGHEPWGMYDHIKRYPWVLDLQEYEDLKDLLGSVSERIIGPAEARAKRSEQ